MKLYSNSKRVYRPVMRFIAAVMLPVVVSLLAPMDLIAQTYREYNDSRSNVDRYFDRAERMGNEQDWQNYVELGIASERVQWEQEAYDTLMERVSDIEASAADQETKEAQVESEVAVFEAARADWEDEARQQQDEKRGEFLARQEAVAVAEVDQQEYFMIIAAAEAAVAANPAHTLTDWENAIATDHAALVAAFEVDLTTALDTARTNNAALTGDALASFENELDAIEAEIRKEFETRDNFYITRARNRYVAIQRGDDLNAKLAAESGSAEAVVDEIIAVTQDQLKAETSDALELALTEADDLVSPAGAANFEAAGTNWEARMEAVIDNGLKAWQQAEEDLYAKRLAWQQETDRSREEGNRIWQQQYDELISARDNWINEVQAQIQEGRDQWQAKLVEFQESRQQA